MESPSSANIIVDGQSILNFGGSSYLGLANHPEVVEAGLTTLKQQGAACQLPRHYGFEGMGNHDVEEAARAYFSADGAMYFSTGYMFGLIAMAGLSDWYDVILLDERAHYTLIDGAYATRKPVHTFKHCDADDLARALEEHCSSGARPLVGTDGMFATFGESPPLDRYAPLIERYHGWLVVDESHSFGSLGATGCGAAEMAGVRGQRVIQGGSLGKAFCAQGGLAIGPSEIIDRFWQTPAARGAVAGNPSGASMAAAAMRLIRREPDRLSILRRNSEFLKAGLRELGLTLEDTGSPIATFTYRTAETMRAIEAGLWAKKIYVILSSYIGSGPTGAIRIAAFADHTQEDFERLFEELGSLL